MISSVSDFFEVDFFFCVVFFLVAGSFFRAVVLFVVDFSREDFVSDPDFVHFFAPKALGSCSRIIARTSSSVKRAIASASVSFFPSRRR